MNYVNLTAHIIRLNDGREFLPSGKEARIKTSYTKFNEYLMCQVTFGDLENLPDPVENTIFIVSGMIAKAVNRLDVVAPATGHPDCVRVLGQVHSVPGFVSEI